DFQDFDNDGWEDLVFTALAGETFPLFRNDRHGGFAEATQSSGLAPPPVTLSGWCALAVHLDNDGWKDLFTANSHVNDRIGDFEALAWKQPNSLFMNDGRGRFRGATSGSGLDAAAAGHRGCGAGGFHDERAPAPPPSSSSRSGRRPRSGSTTRPPRIVGSSSGSLAAGAIATASALA